MSERYEHEATNTTKLGTVARHTCNAVLGGTYTRANTQVAIKL